MLARVVFFLLHNRNQDFRLQTRCNKEKTEHVFGMSAASREKGNECSEPLEINERSESREKKRVQRVARNERVQRVARKEMSAAKSSCLGRNGKPKSSCLAGCSRSLYLAFVRCHRRLADRRWTKGGALIESKSDVSPVPLAWSPYAGIIWVDLSCLWARGAAPITYNSEVSLVRLVWSQAPSRLVWYRLI